MERDIFETEIRSGDAGQVLGIRGVLDLGDGRQHFPDPLGRG